ncbi:MAG: HypC/HybG/HupF family hydrogenase formation chaperone [Nitrospirae bacterium]|nr:HypC/HybG/HupF family hydrogenase formation chaperone [Nitrospirota bacterium]
MCLAIPSKIVKIKDLNATVDVYGARRDISLFLMPEDVSIGDFVLVHAGFAIQKVDKDAAQESLEYIKQILAEAEEESVKNRR